MEETNKKIGGLFISSLLLTIFSFIALIFTTVLFCTVFESIKGDSNAGEVIAGAFIMIPFWMIAEIATGVLSAIGITLSALDLSRHVTKGRIVKLVFSIIPAAAILTYLVLIII